MKKFLRIAIAVALVCLLLPLGCGCEKKKKAVGRYEITAEYAPSTATVTGTVKLAFVNPTSRALDTLKFNLYPNAYREDALYKAVSQQYKKAAYYNGESFGQISVLSVSGGKRWQVGGEDKNILYVELEEPLYPDEKVVVDIGFATKLASVNHRTGVTKNGVNLGNFFPVLCGIKNNAFFESAYYSDGDPFFSDVADYNVTLVMPKDYVIASTARVTAVKGLESKKEYTMSAMNVRDVAVFASEKYRVIEEKLGKTQLRYYYITDGRAKESFACIKRAFAFFEKTFGAYPYKEYSVAQADFCYGGMEYPCLGVVSPYLNEEEYLHTLAHETAHQWWYAVVGSDQTTNAWQDEGLAEYSTAMFFDEYSEYGFTKKQLVADSLAAVREFVRVYGSVFGEADTRMTRSLAEYVSEYEYRSVAYDKGMVLFNTLERSVGKKKFKAALRKYYEENKFLQATPHNLIGAFERVGADVSGLVEGFLSGKGEGI